MFLPVMMIALFFIGQSAYAQQSEKGLKDIYANYFRIGTCFPYAHTATTETALRNVILREFNSITHENGLKPQNTMQQSGSTDNDIKVAFNNEAKNVMQFAVDNKIPIRGHTFVWHSQTPEWFFYANMQSGNKNNLATKEVMYKRMESYIKNMFAAIKAQYPTLNLYAYDVANEIFDNNGKPRPGGFYSDGNNGDNSPWVKVFGNNSFVDSAFTYARRHAPANCKLFYNDFNEYMGKADSMVALYKRLKAKNVIDGLGMQSHLSTSYPSAAQYTTALNKFIAAGAEIHVTELDITIESGASEATQATRYKEIFQALKKAKEDDGKVTSVSIWGVRDDWSWRASNNRNPLLFTSSYAKKQAYNQVAALIPEKDHGDGKPTASSSSVVTPSSSSVAASSSSSSVAVSSSSSSVKASSSSSSVVPSSSSSSVKISSSSSSLRTSSSSLSVVPSSSSDDSSSSTESAESSSSDGGDAELSSSSDDPISPIRQISHISKAEFSVSSLNNKSLLIESKSGAAIYLYNIKGYMVQEIAAPAGRNVVRLSVPNGIYVVKNAGTGQMQKVMVK